MSPSLSRLRRARFIALFAASLVGGCEVVAFSVDSSTGRIVVRLEEDGRDRRDGYRMRVRHSGAPDQVIVVRSGEPLALTVPAAGPVELTLLAPSGCHVTRPNPRTVEPAADGTVTARFTVRCTP